MILYLEHKLCTRLCGNVYCPCLNNTNITLYKDKSKLSAFDLISSAVMTENDMLL